MKSPGLLDPRIEFTPSGVAASLASEECPTCDRPKKPGNPLCLTCFRKLPFDTRARLTDSATLLRVGPVSDEDRACMAGAMGEAIRRLTDGDTSAEGDE